MSREKARGRIEKRRRSLKDAILEKKKIVGLKAIRFWVHEKSMEFVKWKREGRGIYDETQSGNSIFANKKIRLFGGDKGEEETCSKQ